MTSAFSSIESALTPEEKIKCTQIKQEIFSELESSELNERVKKAVALVIEWDIFKPQLYDELLVLLKSAKDIPELRTSINQLAPLIFMMIAKTHFVTDDLRAHRNSNMHDKRYSL